MLDGTPLLAAWARRRLARLESLDPAATQARLLRRLLQAAREARFGRAHGFGRIADVAEFQRQVPLRRYEAFWDEWWRRDYPVLRDITTLGRPPYVALSSGTSAGSTKRIPVTAAMMRANRGAAMDALAWHLRHHPRSHPFAGRSFMLGGSTALEEVGPGVLAGDLSGIAVREIPWMMRPWAWPPERVALMPDWDAKIAALAERTPRRAIRVLTGTPAWLLMLLAKMAPDGAPPMPALELLIHGGVAWGPYRDRIAPYLPPGCATREVYPASEGFVAIADRGDGEGLRLNIDRGVFFEFVPVAELESPNPTRHWVATIETGIDYAVVMTTCAGLYAYVIGDVVRFVDRAPPRLLITGRTAWTLSAFGEHLAGHEVVTAVEGAVQGLGEWCCGAELVGHQGRHCYLLEAEGDAAALATAIDIALADANDDYAAHRIGGQLLPPEILLLPAGRFEAWMRRSGRLGGQNKVSRIIAEPSRFAAVRKALTSP